MCFNSKYKLLIVNTASKDNSAFLGIQTDLTQARSIMVLFISNINKQYHEIPLGTFFFAGDTIFYENNATHVKTVNKL